MSALPSAADVHIHRPDGGYTAATERDIGIVQGRSGGYLSALPRNATGNAFCGTRYIKVHRDKSPRPCVTRYIAHPLDRFSKLKHSIARRVPVPNRAAVERSTKICPTKCCSVLESHSLRSNEALKTSQGVCYLASCTVVLCRPPLEVRQCTLHTYYIPYHRSHRTCWSYIAARLR